MNRYFSQLGRPAVVLLFGLSVSACGGGGGDNPGGGNPPGTTADTRPEPVSFAVPVVENMAPGLSLESAPVFVKGIDEDVSIAASVEGGLIAVNSETDFVEGPVEVGLDDRILVRTTAPEEFSASHTATLTLGEGEGAQSAEFTLATGASAFSVEPGLKSLTFKWDAMEGVSHFKLLENADGASGFTEVDLEIAGDAVEATLPDIPVHLIDWNNARYQLHACNGDSGCVSIPKHEVSLKPEMAVQAVGYFKASNTGEGDGFGQSVAISADGRTLAVGAPGEDSDAVGIGGDQDSNGATERGAVYVFAMDDNKVWHQTAYVKASNAGIFFGRSLSLSADGKTLAVGAPGEGSATTGVNGDQADTLAPGSGAVYVFSRDGGAWLQEAYIKASNTQSSDRFGLSVDLSPSGNLLAIGAPFEDGGATGVGGDEADNGMQDSGAVYVFERFPQGWQQQAYVKASNTGAEDEFGRDVSLSNVFENGNVTMIVGAPNEASAQIDDETDNASPESGAAYVFVRHAGEWTQRAYIKASNIDAGDAFGSKVVISADGKTVLVAAPNEDSGATILNGDQTDNSKLDRGAAYLFVHDVTDAWLPDAYIKSSVPGRSQFFGKSLSINADGRRIVAGADQSDGVGQAFYFSQNTSGMWQEAKIIEATNRQRTDSFGISVALSADGLTITVGAIGEDSEAVGIGGDGTDNGTKGSGAVYIY